LTNLTSLDLRDNSIPESTREALKKAIPSCWIRF